MAKHNIWMSVSDLMTGLMIIFLFIAIAYMIEVEKNQNVLVDYVETKTKLHDKLVDEFSRDTANWQMTIGKDLSMKFNNPTVLFASGKTELTQEFKDILDEFLPRYFDILLHDTLRTKIQEIRIEGHTDDSRMTAAGYDTDPYLGNLQLSQNRSRNVVKYFRSMEVYQSYSDAEKKLIDYWLTANGLSYGRAVDDDGNFIIESGHGINRQRSRRVEFRIVTSGEEVLENFVKQNESKEKQE